MDPDVQDESPGRRATIEVWSASWRLAVMVSTVAGLLTATFAERMDHSTLIVAVIVGASLIGWFGAERAPAARGGSRH